MTNHSIRPMTPAEQDAYAAGAADGEQGCKDVDAYRTRAERAAYERGYQNWVGEAEHG